MKAHQKIVVGALAASLSLALFALPPRRGPDSVDPTAVDQIRGNPLGDASLAAARARAIEKKKKEREQALLRAAERPAAPTAPSAPPPKS